MCVGMCESGHSRERACARAGMRVGKKNRHPPSECPGAVRKHTPQFFVRVNINRQEWHGLIIVTGFEDFLPKKCHVFPFSKFFIPFYKKDVVFLGLSL